MNMINWLNEFMWKILSLFPILCKVVRINVLHIDDEITHTELLQTLGWILLLLMFFAGMPGSVLLGMLLLICSRQTREWIYQATSILLIISVIWIIIPVPKYIPYDIPTIKDTIERVFISLNPIRVTIALLYYQLACITYDLRWTDPKDLAKAMEEKEEQIDTYFEEGEE